MNHLLKFNYVLRL